MATLLLIEDNDNLRSALRRGLLRLGFIVEEARNGREGMDIFRRKRIDLVITDLHMAEQEGIETITNIRQASEDVPIIAISGAGDLSLEDAVLMGANMRFNKPFSIDDLLAAIAVLLSEAEEEGGPPGGEASP
jgi:DNA-binding response OmpR family regulator